MIAFDGRDDDTWQLIHVSRHAFSWLHPRDDFVRRARNVSQPSAYYLFRFETDTDGVVNSVYRTHDADYAEAERYALVKEEV